MGKHFKVAFKIRMLYYQIKRQSYKCCRFADRKNAYRNFFVVSIKVENTHISNVEELVSGYLLQYFKLGTQKE